MTFQAQARVTTTEASRYLQQLCKHWAHKLDVCFTPAQGSVVFPRDLRGADWPGNATLDLVAHPDGLECRLTASNPAQLAALQGAVARHLDRFAFREGPFSYDWKPLA